MHQKNFVICDQEADYARNLMQMIGGRKELGFQMHMFQKLEPLKKIRRTKANPDLADRRGIFAGRKTGNSGSRAICTGKSRREVSGRRRKGAL